MRIAGVSVNEKYLPTKETIIRLALKTKEYAFKSEKVALKLINKEINDSKLFKTRKPKARKQSKPIPEDNRGVDNNKQSEHINTSS